MRRERVVTQPVTQHVTESVTGHAPGATTPLLPGSTAKVPADKSTGIRTPLPYLCRAGTGSATRATGTVNSTPHPAQTNTNKQPHPSHTPLASDPYQASHSAPCR